MGGYVFVSYSREDADYVERLVDHLREHDIDVRLDKQMPIGATWERWICDNIDASSAVIVVMTPAADESARVTDEWTWAREHDKPIKPLLLTGKPFYGLAQLQCEDVQGERMPSTGFVKSLRDDVAPNRPQDRPGPGPLVLSGVLTTSMGTARPSLVRSPVAQLPKRVIWSPDGRFLAASAGWSNSGVWIVVTGQSTEPKFTPPHTLSWLGAGDLFVAGFRKNNVIEVCQAGTLFRHTLRHRKPEGRGVMTVAVLQQEAIGEHVNTIAGAPDGERLAAATTRGKIAIWNRNGVVQSRLGQHRGEVHAISWSCDGRWVATVGADRTLRIWDSHDGTVQVRQERTGAITAVDWSPDKRVATGHDDQRLVVRAQDGEVLRELTEHRGPVSSVVWAPDGQHLASTSDDGISIWHAGSGKRLRLLTVPRGTQRSASWAPDGRQLASVGDDNVIHIWEIWR